VVIRDVPDYYWYHGCSPTAGMMVLGYWFNITSDRELCEECEDRLSFRKFIGIEDDEEVPVHSSLTHWRQRLGPEVFRGLLEKSIEAAVEFSGSLPLVTMRSLTSISVLQGSGCIASASTEKTVLAMRRAMGCVVVVRCVNTAFVVADAARIGV
jgi:hypothetical protein